jgi:outer membrane lipoprotein SlyB
MTKQLAKRTSLATLALFLAASGCSQPLSTREKSTLVGGGLGAATGAIIGAAVGAPGAGAAIGGALGAGTGALVGDQMQSRDVQQAEQQRQIEQNQRELQRQREEIDSMKRQKRRSDDDEY